MEVTTYLRFILALILVLGLIMGLAWVLKRLGLRRRRAVRWPASRRLSTVESAALDSRHKVVLVRRDDVEHLVLIGPNTSQVIERGIAAAASDDTPGFITASPLSAFKQLLSKEKQP